MKVLNWLNERSLHLVHVLLFLCHDVAANTEIINFSSSREPLVDLPLDVFGNWSTLHPTDNERRWFIEPAALHTPLSHVCSHPNDTTTPFSWTCPHTLWLLLDLDDDTWASCATFTLRLSWAASIPVAVDMAVYTPQEVLARHSPPNSTRVTHASASPPPTTRARIARVRAVHAGVTPPDHARPPPGLSSPPPSQSPPSHPVVVPLNVVLEPVYGGVLPATLLPTVGWLVVVVFAAAALVPRVMASLEPHVRQAREDVSALSKRR